MRACVRVRAFTRKPPCSSTTYLIFRHVLSLGLELVDKARLGSQWALGSCCVPCQCWVTGTSYCASFLFHGLQGSTSDPQTCKTNIYPAPSITIFKRCKMSRAVAMHTFNPSTLEAEAGGSLWVWGQPSLQSEFQGSQEKLLSWEIENLNIYITYIHICVCVCMFLCRRVYNMSEREARGITLLS